MNVVVIVQARMTSTRLPGKILKKVLGKPLLSYQIERLKKVRNAATIVIATTTNDTDDPIVEFCRQNGIQYVRGSELNVLSRYHLAAEQFQADSVVRITSDCPLIDPQIIDSVIQEFLNGLGTYDYVSNCSVRSFPRGMDTEVFSARALKEAFLEATEDYDKEHVTPFIIDRPERFPQQSVKSEVDHSRHRWTVDTPEDFLLIRTMLEEIYPKSPEFTLDELLQLHESHPDWHAINAHIEQKK